MIAFEDPLFIRRGFDVNEKEVQDAVDRAVRNEARILTIETTVKAVAEISNEVRKEVRNLGDELRRHSGDDNTRFASVDSRFVGEQNQLTQILNAVRAIEDKMTEENQDVDKLVKEVFDEDGNSRLRPLLSADVQRREFWHALRAQWTFVAGGAGLASTLIGVIVALTHL